jgi:uncharacterized HhH-GPD family protein
MAMFPSHSRPKPDDSPQAPPAFTRRRAASAASNVVAAILRYGREQQDANIGLQPQFTTHAEANQLVIDDPFAFLIAVILDQGIPAERAWRGPFELRQRLGHLDPNRISTRPGEVAAAVAQAPALHRFTTKMANWLVAAGSIVVRDYQGDTRLIWSGRPRATDLAARLCIFPGISQKKSAMAVEMLARDLGVPIQELSGSDIAYDIHIRRVFLRTGIAERDDADHMVRIARRLHPKRPGELDFPTWLIGRRWCAPTTPDCTGCALNSVCPRDIDRAAGI